MGLVLLVIAWRISAKGRVVEATLFGAFAAMTSMKVIGLIPVFSFLHDEEAQITGLVAAAAAVVIGCYLVVRRSLTRGRVTWLVAVVFLAALYPHRDFLDEPTSSFLSFAPLLLVLFGLTWRLLTASDFFQGDSKLFPRSTRVLLFIANSLFAVTTIAFIALARGKGTYVDNVGWTELGDWALGEPLFTAALVGGLWLALRQPKPVDASPEADTYPEDESSPQDSDESPAWQQPQLQGADKLR